MPKATKLSFKGDSTNEKKRKKKRKAETSSVDDQRPEEGWVPVQSPEDITGPIIFITTSTEPPSVLCSFESSNKVQFVPIPSSTSLTSYEPASVSEVFVSKRLPDSSKISFRSAFDRYLGSDKFGIMGCEREAIGPSEEWEVVMREDGVALQTSWEKFLRCDDDGTARADSDSVGFREVLQMRCQAANRPNAKKKKQNTSTNAEELEIEQIKKFHSWGGGRLVLTKEDTAELKKAKKSGALNEALLDRRAKIKSDKFCK